MAETSRTDEEVEKEIQLCIKKMHDNINDSEKLAFLEGKLTGLRWVRGRE
jgi:hypothetical protein